MTLKTSNSPCQALTKKGKPCRAAATEGEVPPAKLTREQCENLKALGYIPANTRCD